jgi:hypothetical protein
VRRCSSALRLARARACERRRLEISNQGIRATYSGLKVADGGGSELAVRCPVTLEGSFHSRTIDKVAGTLIGYITRAIVNRTACSFTGGTTDFTILNGSERLLTGDIPASSIPWHIRYEQFFGGLPTCSSVITRLILLSVLLLAFGMSCLYRSNATEVARFGMTRNATTKQITSYSGDVLTRIPKAGGPLTCPETVTIEGDSVVRVLGSATQLIFINLI